MMFHRAIAPHGQKAEETEKRFRTRAYYRVIVQERLEPREAVRRRTMCHPSSEGCFSFSGVIWSILQQGTEEGVVLHSGIWEHRGGEGGEARMRQAKSLERQEEFHGMW